jgi:hypothetical protein
VESVLLEATCSSETAADFQQATRHYIAEESTRHNRLRSYMTGIHFIVTHQAMYRMQRYWTGCEPPPHT